MRGTRRGLSATGHEARHRGLANAARGSAAVLLVVGVPLAIAAPVCAANCALADLDYNGALRAGVPEPGLG